MEENICGVCCMISIRRKTGKSSKNPNFQAYQNLGATESLICTDCFACLNGAQDKKEEITGTEEKLRQKQIQVCRLKREILKLLKDLERSISGFRGEIDKLEGAVKKGEGNVSNMDSFFSGEELTNSPTEFNQFREKMLIVVDDLRDFNKHLAITRNVPVKALKIVPPVKYQEQKENENVSNCQTDNNIDWDNGLDNSGPEDNGLDNSGPEDNFSMGHESNDSSSNSDWAASKNKTKSPSKRKCIPEDKPKKRQKLISPKKLKSHSSDGNPDKVKSKPCVTPKVKKPKTKSLLDTLDLSKMSEFKKRTIMRIVSRMERGQGQGHRYWYKGSAIYTGLEVLKNNPLTYDPTTDTLNMAGYQLVMNEQLEVIECITCGHQCHTRYHGMPDKYVFNHILHDHLNLLKCPYCQLVRRDAMLLYQHILVHQNNFKCDICGRPCHSEEVVKNHKWSHLSKEEFEERIKNGEKPPKQAEKKVVSTQCNLCGRVLKNLNNFKNHMKSHNKESLEARFVCQTCGKKYHAKKSFQMHCRFVCYPGKDEGVPKEAVLPVQCDECPKRFRDETALKIHKAQRHSEERPFACDKCEKTFKTQGQLHNHRQLHTTERPFKCKVAACTSAFKNKVGLRHHNKRCKFLKKLNG